MRAFEGYPAPFVFGWGGCEGPAAFAGDCATIAGFHWPASGESDCSRGNEAMRAVSERVVAGRRGSDRLRPPAARVILEPGRKAASNLLLSRYAPANDADARHSPVAGAVD